MVVLGPRQDWLSKVQAALSAQGFTNIETSANLFQVTADYKKATVWGYIKVTLLPEADDTRIAAAATANVDNIWALFKSPTKTILDQFRGGM